MIQDTDDQVRAIELAEWLGVSERAVADYAHRGIITRSGRAVFPLKESIRAVCHHFREAASARGATSGGLTAQRERIAREQADKLEMQNAASRREMLPAKAVADEWASILRMVRSRVLASPSRIQQQLGHLSAHDVAVIDREMRDALEELSNNGL
jgi:phage terminase Nu1 subunit (DNA packaging protein)